MSGSWWCPGIEGARLCIRTLVGLGTLLWCAAALGAPPTAKLQGRIIATDTGEPIGFADLLLLPSDSTMTRVGGLANGDGTFLLQAAPGTYTFQVRAMSYTTKRIPGVVLTAGSLVPVTAALTPEAIRQDEVVVEGRALQNNETALLVARKKAASLSDAVSAEQVRRSPDKDAAEVLRRVTGLSVLDGKYVFVRGLGERYSSTEVDGVRIASPEQNKRVVPLDLIPANLLDNIVVQKTYTADRPGEFGGGDVQVRTKDFPGKRTWSFSISQGYTQGVTFHHLRTYAGSAADVFGFGSGSRRIPDEVREIAGDRPLTLSNNPELGFSKAALADVGKAFRNVWTPTFAKAPPNGGYAVTYGDELHLFGRPVGLVESWSLSRGFDQQDETQRFFKGGADTLYDYAVSRSTESVQLGGLSAASLRLSPRHTLHLRGIWTHSAEDEVRVYEGVDHNVIEATTGTWLQRRGTRLSYVERDILSASLEGRHEFARLLGTSFDWAVSRSTARRLQPDRRTTGADRFFYDDGTGNLVDVWSGGGGYREYGDLRDRGWGVKASATVPYRLGGLGNGKVVLGYDQQTKKRNNFLRRFNFIPGAGSDGSAPAESLFTPGDFDGSANSAYVDEATLDRDNYVADQGVKAGFVSIDLPLGGRLRGTFGIRVERGVQDVRSFDLFVPDRITAQGGFANTDWLPSGNLTWVLTEDLNVRMAASRTLSRPDLNELSPSPSLEYRGGLQQAGNPDLHRALIDNYDLRFESFPGLGEVVATGFFYKRLHEPIEQTVQGGSPSVLEPRNSDYGINVGAELEARLALGRFWGGLRRWFVNTNATFITSTVRLKPQLSPLGSTSHPLQGQARYIVNSGVTYTSPGSTVDASVLLVATGERLRTLGLSLPDVYEQPSVALDATANLRVLHASRVKLAAKNLLDPWIRQLQDRKEVSSYRAGRRYSIAYAFGS